ncbi:hypothetical protein HKD37_04G010410 [Glycine soja]
MQSYPARALGRRLQVDWARDPRVGPRVLMSLRAHLGGETLFSMAYSLMDGASYHLFSFVFRCISMDPIQAQRSSLHRSPTSKLPSSVMERKTREKRKRKKRVEEISQDERKKIREEERRKIMKEMKREKHASYSSHNSCKSLSEELRDYYEGRDRSHLRPHSHRREKERKPQEANIKLSYFHGKDNVEANLDWEIRPKDDKGKTIEKQAPKASMQEKTSSIKCFKCLGRGHITSQCPTTKTMIMRGQDIYSSQDEATTSPSSSESEKAKGEESKGQPLVVKEKCKEVSVSSKSLAKKETHFTIKTNIKETFPLRQPPHFLFCKKALASIATPLGLEFIPQVKKLSDEGLVRKSLNPCALLVPKIGVEGRSPEYEEPRDLRTNPFQGGGNDAILSRKGIGILPSFLSKAHLGGEALFSMAYSLMDGASSHLFSFVFRCISMVENHH